MMLTQIQFVIMMIMFIPICAAIDYQVFKDKVIQESGITPNKTYWLLPCVLEIGCFIIGYLIGSA